MSVKASRGLTHAKRLYAPEAWSDRMARSWHELGDRREVLLVQLRPDQERDDARLDWFLGSLPDWVRVAVELRHPSWQHDEVFALLERHGAANVRDERRPPAVRAAGDRADRLRAHARAGPPAPLRRLLLRRRPALVGGPGPRVVAARGHDVLVYFNNDGGGNAVRNARTLRRLRGRLTWTSAARRARASCRTYARLPHEG